MLAIRRLSAALPRRALAMPMRRSLSAAANVVHMTFRDKDGVETPVEAKPGSSLLDVALEYKLDVEAACGGECACSTCHVILPSEFFNKLPEVSEEEEDMLDLAAGLTDTSRLACQVEVSAALEGMVVQLPEEVNNMMAE